MIRGLTRAPNKLRTKNPKSNDDKMMWSENGKLPFRIIDIQLITMSRDGYENGF